MGWQIKDRALAVRWAVAAFISDRLGQMQSSQIARSIERLELVPAKADAEPKGVRPLRVQRGSSCNKSRQGRECKRDEGLQRPAKLTQHNIFAVCSD
jgi:hypothetical protein